MKKLLIVLALFMVGMNTLNAQDTWVAKAGYFGGNIFSAASFSICLKEDNKIISTIKIMIED